MSPDQIKATVLQATENEKTASAAKAAKQMAIMRRKHEHNIKE